ncbi:MAG TPA: hypothetical protein VGI83_01005 [Gemmatimonadales bacterium]
MRRGLSFSAAVAAMMMMPGCATRPAQVPASIDPAGRMLLTGEWSGTYESPSKSRSGYITFELEQDADSTVCRGDVLMVPRENGQPVRTPITGVDPRTGQQYVAPRLLAIEALRVTGDKLSGRIEPYNDPETMHPVRTSFEGRIKGEAIRGSLVTTDEQTGQQFMGTWVVTRQHKVKQGETGQVAHGILEEGH